MKSQYEYINNFNRQNYDRITIMLPKGKKEHIKQIASQNGESINSLVNKLLQNISLPSDNDLGEKAV